MSADKFAEAEFLEAVHSQSPVAGLTHGFYRYPARFSPLFAREAIKCFTEPGDLVLDPFMGGGTTLVEASVLGREAIGTDISSLAAFISRVKTTLLSEDDIRSIRSWASYLPAKLNLRNSSTRSDEWATYQRNINSKGTWHIRKTLELVVSAVQELANGEQQRFARCVLLKTAQWALDCRTIVPTAKQFRQQMFEHLKAMIKGAVEYTTAVKNTNAIFGVSNLPAPACLHRSAVGIETDEMLSSNQAPRLILTSPPYPGVHVLYHRWQIQGRRETPAPYWITNSLDGSGASYYTFGDRKQQGLTRYYEQAYKAFTSLSHIADDRTILIQMVAFPDPSWQLPKYLDVMSHAGFVEAGFPQFANSPDGRLWRSIPNRKWYAEQRGEIATSKEVVLFHRLK